MMTENPSTPLITPLAVAHAADMAALHLLCFPEKPWDASFFQAQLSHKGVAYGILLNQKLISFLLAQVVEDEAELLTIATHPQYQKQGWAQRLLSAFLAESTFEKCYLEVRHTNGPAISLYARVGFIKKNVRKAYYTTEGGASEDALIYAYSK